MEYVEFNKNLDKSILQNLNIVIDKTSKVADGVKIFPNVCIRNSNVGKNSEINYNSVIENSFLGENNVVKSSFITDSTIGDNCVVGPFAHIRLNSEIGNDCRIGNFVEIKKSQIGNGTKMAHLTYIGDAIVGKNCNIGCGVVFCNYNGKIKQQSILGDNVFVGSNVNLIAPLSIGNNAFIAAGSTINKDIAENQFSIARAEQRNKVKL